MTDWERNLFFSLCESMKDGKLLHPIKIDKEGSVSCPIKIVIKDKDETLPVL